MQVSGIFKALSAKLLLVALCAALVAGKPSLKAIHKAASKDADGLARLTMKNFIENVVAEGKEYSVVVQLTALDPKYKCKPCQELDASLRMVSRGWKKHGDKSRIAFGTLDIEDGEELFKQMGIEKVPRLMIFPADIGKHAFKTTTPRELNIGAKTIQPQGMADKLGELFGTQIKADIPVDYSKYILNACTGIAALYAVYLAYKFVNLRAVGKNAWAMGTILFVLFMTSGFMWNRINKPPYMGSTRDNDVVLFAPTNQQQYAVETQIVAATYSICAFCIVILVRYVPRIPNRDQRVFLTFAGVAALLMTFSYLNSVFRLKMPSYPYKLLFP